jgi:hypothetical protein
MMAEKPMGGGQVPRIRRLLSIPLRTLRFLLAPLCLLDVLGPVSAELPVTPLFPFPAVQVPDAHQLATADFNHDGFPDVATLSALINPRRQNLYILYGQCDGSFEIGSVLPLTGGDTYALKAADFNLDGNVDLVVASKPPQKLDFFINLGTGNFVPSFSYELPGLQLSSIAEITVADFNTDGRPDVAATVAGAQPSVLVFMSTPIPFLFSRRMVDSGSSFATRIAAGDVNGDGQQDLVVGHETPGESGGEPIRLPGTISVVPNAGDGSFGAPLIVTRKACVTDFIGVWDLDHDGDDDIVTTHAITDDPDPRIVRLLSMCRYLSLPGRPVL